MQKEDQNKNWRHKIESQLLQIKVLLIILINLFLLGFYGLSRAMREDIAGILLKISEITMVTGLLVTLLIFYVWIAAQSSLSKTNSQIDKEETDKEKQS